MSRMGFLVTCRVERALSSPSSTVSNDDDGETRLAMT
jgi:hypothetical protein